MEFHVDAFNVFNHAQFNPPGNDVNAAATFGIITSDFGDAARDAVRLEVPVLGATKSVGSYSML